MKSEEKIIKNGSEIVFAIKDNATGLFELVGTALTSAQKIRELVPILVRSRPLTDLELYDIGSFDLDTSEIFFHSPTLIDWKSYNYPESRAEALAPLGLDEFENERIQKEKELFEQLKIKYQNSSPTLPNE